jgi:hypothetical protein
MLGGRRAEAWGGRPGRQEVLQIPTLWCRARQGLPGHMGKCIAGVVRAADHQPEAWCPLRAPAGSLGTSRCWGKAVPPAGDALQAPRLLRAGRGSRRRWVPGWPKAGPDMGLPAWGTGLLGPSLLFLTPPQGTPNWQNVSLGQRGAASRAGGAASRGAGGAQSAPNPLAYRIKASSGLARGGHAQCTAGRCPQQC